MSSTTASSTTSGTGQLPLRFLTIGLPPDHPAIPAHLRPKIAELLAQANEQFTHANAPITHINVTPDDQSAFLAALRTAPPVNAVIIGYGVRSPAPLTHFLERLIELIRVEGGAECRVLFNTTPMDVVEAIQRWYPEVKLDNVEQQQSVKDMA